MISHIASDLQCLLLTRMTMTNAISRKTRIIELMIDNQWTCNAIHHQLNNHCLYMISINKLAIFTFHMYCKCNRYALICQSDKRQMTNACTFTDISLWLQSEQTYYMTVCRSRGNCHLMIILSKSDQTVAHNILCLTVGSNSLLPQSHLAQLFND